MAEPPALPDDCTAGVQVPATLDAAPGLLSGEAVGAAVAAPAQGPVTVAAAPKRFSDEAVAALRAVYASNPRPSDHELVALAKKVGETFARVKSWFQRRRNKASTEERKRAADAASAAVDAKRAKVVHYQTTQDTEELRAKLLALLPLEDEVAELRAKLQGAPDANLAAASADAAKAAESLRRQLKAQLVYRRQSNVLAAEVQDLSPSAWAELARRVLAPGPASSTAAAVSVISLSEEMASAGGVTGLRKELRTGVLAPEWPLSLAFDRARRRATLTGTYAGNRGCDAKPAKASKLP